MGTFEDIEESRYNRMVEENIQEMYQNRDDDKLFGISLRGHVKKVAEDLGIILEPEKIEEIAKEAKETYRLQVTYTSTPLDEAIAEAVSIMEYSIERDIRAQKCSR